VVGLYGLDVRLLEDDLLGFFYVLSGSFTKFMLELLFSMLFMSYLCLACLGC